MVLRGAVTRMSRVDLWKEPGAAGPVARRRTVHAGAPVFAAAAAGGAQDGTGRRSGWRMAGHRGGSAPTRPAKKPPAAPLG